MKHRDTEELATVLEEYIDSRREYILGVADEVVFETDDPTEAAVLAISGSPTQ
ncbi:hypothetical protein [Natronoglomus mannanivorans]|uniref:Uncharacterized protein n=1 Tax=Natronoglomus mannanivorans TaxID=2979990 RepID=A0AAP2Z3R1_9EURY|nr:hypothetical protein [Halobacteria archaeon AArc-xg1-1]